MAVFIPFGPAGVLLNNSCPVNLYYLLFLHLNLNLANIFTFSADDAFRPQFTTAGSRHVTADHSATGENLKENEPALGPSAVPFLVTKKVKLYFLKNMLTIFIYTHHI
jgi:hypothetical protein